MTQINLNNLNVFYSQTLIENLTLTFPGGWTGISGPNGCGKTSLIHCLIADLRGSAETSMPHQLQWNGTITGPSSLCYLPQLPEPDMEALNDFFYSGDNDHGRISSLLELKEEWLYRPDEISQGQKRRLQLALALAENPEILILDEPENHLDQAGRELVINTLRQYEGIGIIIGHSRNIMNSLCTSTLLIYQKRWHFYQHGLTESLSLYKAEEKSIRKQREMLKFDINRQTKQLNNYVRQSAKAERALSKKGLGRHDHDKKSAIDLARLSGADKASSSKVSLQKKVISSSTAVLGDLQQDRRWKMGLTILGIKSRRDRLIHIPSGNYPLYENFSLDLPELSILADDFIVLRGANGTGKTGILNLIHQRIDPAVPLGWIPQELTGEEKEALLNKYQQLDQREKADVMAYFSRMGSDPIQWIQQQKGSPGEYRKLLMAMIFLCETELLILDEPANHLDIFTIEVIEEALKTYRGAVIMVSHEKEFCSSMINRVWSVNSGRLFLSET
ncbi:MULTISPECIES: ATP-binding cassette domain-containing protein [unclassified Oceanispirochaeta]|uniref:ATP-binding cassette domain-containing protein n=1 Tax=unclassified Oceanispirochaeta TaxID=2635722 RepID=UPI000E08F9ED|nr:MULTISPECIES: ATP-binding cassette domain-containing protein [unclassified Oceanispirochaeta]MBF9017858.1 ABC-F family ATP-binding cassette domain-containing protein [Oceanispirochaeta sp. M2]NPD74369.1 ABC-F family ATP-binding cassette domain-containing protein [Oceanispirochaeta sp. M1]RDG29756.1 ABC transporter ATP-binding protein [Oceanispirochaeta sp. M1]